VTTVTVATGVEAEPFGQLDDGREVTRFVLRTPSASASILDYGAILQSLVVPDRAGCAGDVVLGMADLPGYQAQDAFLGAIVGRVGNRIARGRFTLDDVTYELPLNNGPNNLHGGPGGFQVLLWDAEPVPGVRPRLRLRLTSPDGDQGFPCPLRVTVDYLLDGSAETGPRLWIRYTVRNDEPAGGRSTPVNPTHHAYFNLAGEGSGSVDGHLLRVPASRYTPVDGALIPTGELAGVAGTPLDLRSATEIGPLLRVHTEQTAYARGYDHNWVIDDDAPTLDEPWPGRDPDTASGEDEPADGGPASDDVLSSAGRPLRLALQATDPDSGRRLDVFSDLPGVQLYTANYFDGTVIGKSGRAYRQGDGFTAETQYFPDSPNQPQFPSVMLGPQQVFRSTTVFAFGTA
jgi:aldose 1-epimerase